MTKTKTTSHAWFAAALALAGLSSTLPARADAPAGRFVVSAGTVYDTFTRLTWHQAASTSQHTWSAAQTYCSTSTVNGGGWRLPTANELSTLIDPTRTAPSIDPTAFPSTPADSFWTSSAATVPGSAWVVIFLAGHSGTTVTTNPRRVRCVR